MKVGIGRRNLMFVANGVMISAVVLMLQSSYVCLAIGRLFGGVAFGFFSFLVPLSCNCMMLIILVREISPVEISGFLGSFFVLFVILVYLIMSL